MLVTSCESVSANIDIANPVIPIPTMTYTRDVQIKAGQPALLALGNRRPLVLDLTWHPRDNPLYRFHYQLNLSSQPPINKQRKANRLINWCDSIPYTLRLRAISSN